MNYNGRQLELPRPTLPLQPPDNPSSACRHPGRVLEPGFAHSGGHSTASLPLRQQSHSLWMKSVHRYRGLVVRNGIIWVPGKPKRTSSWSKAWHGRCTMARWRSAHSDPEHLHQLASGEPRLPAHPLMRDNVFPWVTQPKNKTQPHQGTRSVLRLQGEHNHWYRHGAKELTNNRMQPLGTNQLA